MNHGAAPSGPRASRPRSRLAWGAMVLASVAGVVVLLALGGWQVQRLHWKTDLIARVEARLAAPPVAAPGPADWPALSENTDEYRRVTASGNYDFSAETQVKAVTAKGSGYWVLTPLATTEGWHLWVNRGFVPDDRRAAQDRSRPAGPVTVTGLLRITQPGGAFLRQNDPSRDRWFSRDVALLSASRGLGDAAPYFVDAEAGPVADALPLGGLTVVRFRNSHLGYALTWFTMAGGLAAGAWYVLSRDRSQD